MEYLLAGVVYLFIAEPGFQVYPVLDRPPSGVTLGAGFRARIPVSARDAIRVRVDTTSRKPPAPNTPDVDSAEIRTFEPKLIHAILAAVGLDEKSFKGHYTVLGKMKKVRIKMR